MISSAFIKKYLRLDDILPVPDPPWNHPGEDRYYEAIFNNMVDIIGQLLDSAHNGVIAFDEQRRVVVFTKKAEEIYGVKSADIIDRPLAQALPESPLNQFMMESGPMVDHRCLIGDHHILANRTPLILHNKVIGGISVFQDVTRDELMSRELDSIKENELYLESIIENSWDGIYITDRDGRTLKVNRSYERITNIPKEKLIGRYMKDLVNDGFMSGYITDRVVKEKSAVTIKQKANQNQRLLITGNPIFDPSGDVDKVITNVRDISELIELEKKLEISNEMTALYRKELFGNILENNIVCNSPKFKEVLHLAGKVAAKNSTVLLLGETGAGKEVVARYIHVNSKRSGNNYLKINCGAIPPALLESELFGYVGGAFTGANPKGKIGMFALAHEGTLFLDEIGELPLGLQSALLRVLQDGVVTRIGDGKGSQVDVRIIAATNRDLDEMIQNGLFRSDLYYRLNVISITVPPLRERPEDIPGLAEIFLNELNKKYDEQKIITSDFLDALERKEWPGNVRELRNFIEKQFVISDSDILDTFLQIASPGDGSGKHNQQIVVNGLIPMHEAVKTVEATLIHRAMNKYHNTHKAARALEMSQPTFFRKYKEYTSARREHEED